MFSQQPCLTVEGELPKQNSTTPSVTTQAPTVQPHTCPDGMFACQSHGECVAVEKVCDFRRDCSDGLDELHCGETLVFLFLFLSPKNLPHTSGSFTPSLPCAVKEQCDFEGGEMCGWECVQPSLATAHTFLWSGDQGESIHDGEEFHRPVTDHTL